MTIVEFLLARIADDENVTQHADGGLMDDAHFSVTRVLAECEAKRRIVNEHAEGDPDRILYGGLVDPFCQTCEDGHEPVAHPCLTLRALAMPYADHPDYDESWRP